MGCSLLEQSHCSKLANCHTEKAPSNCLGSGANKLLVGSSEQEDNNLNPKIHRFRCSRNCSSTLQEHHRINPGTMAPATSVGRSRIHTQRKPFFIFYFAVALTQSLRKSLGSSLTDTSNKNQPESYTRLLLRSHKGKGPLVAWLCWSHQCLIGLHPVPRDK